MTLTTPEASSHNGTELGVHASAIADLVVGALSESTGRGPTKARTHFGPDCVTVVLENTMTKGERSLVRGGREELVLETRRAFQELVREELVGGVEAILDRKVAAFFSGNNVNPDIAVETFVLEPIVPA